MSKPNSTTPAAHTFTTGARVRISSPTAPDFGQEGVISAVHYAETDSPSYLVRFGEYCRTYGAHELAPAHTFTPIRTADLLDFLVDAVDAARASTAPAAWQRAIDRAYDTLLQLDVIAYDLAAGAIRLASASEPGVERIANGDCPCPAFVKGDGVCYHRAAARLVKRALELRDLADELLTEAQEAGESWYGPDLARQGARYQLPALTGYASDWDRMAAANQTAALAERADFDAFARRFTALEADYNRQTCAAHDDARGVAYWQRIRDRLVALAAEAQREHLPTQFDLPTRLPRRRAN